MEKDFHFCTIYLLSRWAGFAEEQACILATSSQFVDDSILRWHNRVRKKNSPQCFAENIWHRLDNKINYSVWVPFHFLPGLQGDSLEEKMICRKNSALAHDIKEYVSFNQPTLYQAGVMLHAYADIWAHQSFSGLADSANLVTLISAQDVAGQEERELDDLFVSKLAAFFPLGHACAGFYPDKPYFRWQCEKFIRCNWDEYTEAAEAIYSILVCMRTKRPGKLAQERRNLLQRAFCDIKERDVERRCWHWSELFRSGYFGEKIAYVPQYDLKKIAADDDFLRNFDLSMEQYFEWINKKIFLDGLNAQEAKFAPSGALLDCLKNFRRADFLNLLFAQRQLARF